MLIDFHVHAFPDKIAQRAIEKLAFTAGGLTPSFDGTADGLRAMLIASDAKGVLLPIATRPENQRSINDWAATQRDERLICFGSVHPMAPDALDELDRLYALGLRGIKLHPEYQNFAVDDARFKPLWRKAARLGLITVFHAGLDMAYLPPCGCSPEALSRALPAFDGAPVVAAHMGGYMQWESVLSTLCGLPVYLDTAYCQSRAIVPLCQRIIERHGVDKILLGSDAPWSTPLSERAFVGTLGLTPAEQQNVCTNNAMRLLSSVGAIV